MLVVIFLFEAFLPVFYFKIRNTYFPGILNVERLLLCVLSTPESQAHLKRRLQTSKLLVNIMRKSVFRSDIYLHNSYVCRYLDK